MTIIDRNYLRPQRKAGSIQRFWSKLITGNHADCWNWPGRTNCHGYGLFSGWGAHRVSYELHHGLAIPSGMMVCHTCDNRRCVNPWHLFVGTAADNVHDMLSKGRQKGPEGPNPNKRGARNAKCKIADEAGLEKIRVLQAQGLGYRRIAKELGMPHQTIYWAIRRSARYAVQ